MIKTTGILLDELKSYASPNKKIESMVKQGELTPIIRGLYETDKNTPPHYLAASIYGPSYLSFEFALAYYNLIPEAVYVCTSATFEKRKSKRYQTPFGLFTYRDIPSGAYPYGVEQHIENGYCFLLATAEKAICDQLYKMPIITSRRQLEEMLFEDLRIDDSEFAKLNFNDMIEIADNYHSTNLKILKAWLKGKVDL
jgi:predicted transcriptional regulator of viral defense system